LCLPNSIVLGPAEEPPDWTVVPPEPRRPPPLLAERARIRVARVPAVDRSASFRDRGAGAQDRGQYGKRGPVHGQEAHVHHRPQVVERAPASADYDLAAAEKARDAHRVARMLAKDHLCKSTNHDAVVRLWRQIAHCIRTTVALFSASKSCRLAA